MNEPTTPSQPSEEPPGPALVRQFSDRLIQITRKLRVLDALRWDADIEADFFAKGSSRLPAVDRDYYLRRHPCPDSQHSKTALDDLEGQVANRLGDHPAGLLLRSRCQQARTSIALLDARGTPQFATLSAQLYGNTRSALPMPGLRLTELADRLVEQTAQLEADDEPTVEPPMTAVETAQILHQRLQAYFGPEITFQVQVSSALSANAAVAGETLKVRRGAVFAAHEVRLLEVHEGWVHLGTSLNGREQDVCTFLAYPSIGGTTTQEGLAVLTEILALASYPARLRRLAQRVRAVALVEEGADFLEVFRHFLDRGTDARSSWQIAARVFRGSLPSGVGPFTKDLAYARGLVEVLHALGQGNVASRRQKLGLLFAGKVALSELPLLSELHHMGWVRSAKRVPPPFADVRALSAWLCCAGWMGWLGAA